MATFSNSAEVTPPWVELPREITAMILQKLDAVEILTTVEKVCRTWRSVCQDTAMWRCIDMRGVPRKYDWMKMCREAVDRSQGQLIDITIHYFGSRDLLLYISRRSPELRRLRIAYWDGITDEELSETIKNFPLLEELHLYYIYSLPFAIATIRSVGRNCPHLKSFKLNRQHQLARILGKIYILHRELAIAKTMQKYNNKEALAIAENMPQVLHLQLIGSHMTNEGVQAILQGCPHLESLDLRRCFCVDLKGALGQLCRLQIKDLRQPYDATDDYEFSFEHFPDEASYGEIGNILYFGEWIALQYL